jgi:hypothetical protein
MKYTEWLTTGSHFILKRWCNLADQHFRKKFNDLETAQRQILNSILKSSNLAQKQNISSYEQFIQYFSSSRYADWREQINLIVSKNYHFQAVN